ncbi:BACON domain-containing protein [Streptomyces sp. C1-2]|nr:BACON domain-containing protein [Streptomyces sp. C1-2]
MMSSSPQTSTYTPGARPAHGSARTAARPSGSSGSSELPLDGLFTYCLSVLCEHDAAVAALGDVLAVAERRGRNGPEAPGDRRAWLYALARWACRRRLAHLRSPKSPKSPMSSVSPKDTADRRAATVLAAPPGATDLTPETRERRRRELALLAWPEAAGTTPEQREALELAVRHRLAAHEVAAVLGQNLAAARELLASAACEVERTRTALAVVETGTCPGTAHLTGDHRLVLGTALRTELVRHVDDCPRCRRTAERVLPGNWPGATVTPDALPVLPAPRAALRAAAAHPSRVRGKGPRFDRRGFPLDPGDHAARRERLRARALTTTVVATVVAAPVLALWAAYRGAPLIGEGTDGRPATAGEAPDAGAAEGGTGPYENAGNARVSPDSRRSGRPRPAGDVDVAVVGGDTDSRGTGRLAVGAESSGTTTVITLRATGDSPVRWSARSGAPWLYLSRTSGTLAPGESVTVRVYVDHLREPAGPWQARVTLAPGGTTVTIEGYGTAGTPAPDADPPAPPRGHHHHHHHTRPPASPGTPDPDPTPDDPAPDPSTTDPGTPSGEEGSTPPTDTPDAASPAQ